MTNRNKRIKWTNKFSKETGYVKAVKRVLGYFESTDDVNSAKKYKSVKECDDDLLFLRNIGEFDRNDFEIVDIQNEHMSGICKKLFG